MPHENVGASEELAGGLPPFMPNAPSDGNYKLLDAIGERFRKEASDIDDIDKGTVLQEALKIEHTLVVKTGETYVIEEGETEFWTDVKVDGTLIVDGELIIYDAMGLEGLRFLGELVNTFPEEGETKEHYRARLIAEYTLLTDEGTISDILHSASLILDVSVTSIGYDEPFIDEHGTAVLRLPNKPIDESPLTETEITEILDKLIAASYRLEGTVVGTFTYITPSDYDAGDHDASKGYDGLDANGDPKNNGGTYAGILE